MTWHATAELYRIFLECDWWKGLAAKIKLHAGKCARCRATSHLEAHHIRYPENWFDTTLADLEVLCRKCHKKEHGHPAVIFTPNTRKKVKEWRSGNKKRSWKTAHLVNQGKKKHTARRRRERMAGLKRVEWKASQKLRTKPRMHWVSRGSSSN